MKRWIIRLLFAFIMFLPVLSIVNFFVKFVKQMHCTHKTFSHKLPAITPISWPKHGLVTLWFADSNESKKLTEIFELMDEKQVVAAMGVSASAICTYGHLSWKQLVALQNKGWETTSLLYSNDFIHTRYATTTVNTLAASKNALRSRGLRADNAVILLDQGITPEWQEDVRKYYLSSLRIKNQLNQLPVTDPYNLKAYAISSKTDTQAIQQIITDAQKNKGWLILFFYQLDDDIEQFARILAMIKETKMPIVLPTQALDLVRPKRLGLNPRSEAKAN